MKNVAVLEDGAFALFFRPHPGDLTAQESPLPGFCHPRQKILMPGGHPGEGGGGVGLAGIDWCKKL